MIVAVVVGMDGEGGVAEHCFGPRSGDDEMSFRADERVADVPELAGALVVDDFEVADGGLAARAPIDHVAAAVDEAFAIEAKKGFENSAIERGLEREFFARPIAGGAEADHLPLDYAAALRFPLPDAALEFFTAEILALDSFFREHAFDDELSGDACVVHAGKPEGAFATHAVPADEHVDLGVLEHVAHVDRAGDVGRAGARSRIGGRRRCRNFRRGRDFLRTRPWPSGLRFPVARRLWVFRGALVPSRACLKFWEQEKQLIYGRRVGSVKSGEAGDLRKSLRSVAAWWPRRDLSYGDWRGEREMR